MTTLTAEPDSKSRRVAARPSSPGIRMSIRHTSAEVRRTSRTAASPSKDWATTSRSGSPSRMRLRPARTTSWSSATTTRTTSADLPRWSSDRNPGADTEPGTVGTGLGRAPAGTHPLLHAAQAVARARLVPRVTRGTGVAHFELDRRGEPPDRDRGRRGSRVLAHVGERLLDDPVRREGHPLAERRRWTLDPELDADAGCGGRPDELGDVSDARLRGTGRCGAVDAKDAEQPAQLGQRGSAVLLDVGQGLGCLAVVRLVTTLGRGLHDDGGDVVGDDVVQLSRDAGALRHRPMLGEEGTPFLR